MSSAKHRVLFLGRKNCEYTQKILGLLNGAEVTTHLSERRGEQLPDYVLKWSGDYIFAFRSLAILPMSIVESASLGAVNFHPGPPEFPGSGCTNFALYEDADTFGVTAHLMEEVVDSGRILSVRRFPIAPEDNSISLLQKTHAELHTLAQKIIPDALLDDKLIQRLCREGNEEIHWSGTRRRISALHKLSNVQPSISAKELEKRVRAFHYPAFPLTLTLHGRRFALVSDTSKE